MSNRKKQEPSIYDVVKYVHEETVGECECCGQPLTRSDVNDFGTLCERCYMKEYYGGDVE